jgi:DNA-binding XRE family transcriptional regulator
MEPERTDPRLSHLTARNIGEGLYLLRVRAGMKREHLAKLTGRAAGTIWALETNRTQNPNMTIVRSIVRELTKETGDDFEATFGEFVRLLDSLN